MKQPIFRIGIAFLTLTIGIIATSVWIVRHYSSSPSTVFKVFPAKSLDLVKGSLPCVVKQGDIATAKELIASGVNVDSTADSCIRVEPSPRNVTLLMKSALNGDIEMVKFLLENGANVNARDSYDDTPLSYAENENHFEVIVLLVEKGANVNPIEKGERTLLMNASANGHLEVIEYLLNNGANINLKDINGTTALMFAAGFKQLDATNILLQKGANPNLKDKGNRTASTYAKQGYPQEYLISRR